MMSMLSHPQKNLFCLPLLRCHHHRRRHRHHHRHPPHLLLWLRLIIGVVSHAALETEREN